MAQMIGIPSDRVIAYDEECLKLKYFHEIHYFILLVTLEIIVSFFFHRFIREYASNQEMFFADFILAYQKLVNLGLA